MKNKTKTSLVRDNLFLLRLNTIEPSHFFKCLFNCERNPFIHIFSNSSSCCDDFINRPKNPMNVSTFISKAQANIIVP